jgi:peptidoglycan hydrolase-like protein with peptidoglycan-binding domain
MVLSAAAVAAAMLLGISGQAAGVTLHQAAIDSTKTFQMNLWGLSYYHGTITGKASTALTQAGQAFQRDNCINPSGQLGPQTTTALRGRVKEVQAKVKVTADGVYGAKTKAAVVAYQKANGLQGLGMVGPKTSTKLGITRVKKCDVPPDTGNAFLNTAIVSARTVKAQYQVPNAVTAAQAALESRYGISGLSTKSKNYFGFKCFGGRTGDIAIRCDTYPTTECNSSGCYPATAQFRAYRSMTDSFRDYGRLLRTNARYAPAYAYVNDPNQFIRQVHKGGYATDPNYANKVISIMKKYNLYRYG